MTARTKLILWLCFAFAVTLALGWVWGASGRSQAERALRDTEQRLQLSEARGAMLAARLSLRDLNFGEGGAQLDRARARLEQARQRFLDLRQTQAAGALEHAIGLVQDARQKAGALDQTAGERALEALNALEGVVRLRETSAQRPSPDR